jgi:hypothetical protein
METLRRTCPLHGSCNIQYFSSSVSFSRNSFRNALVHDNIALWLADTSCTYIRSVPDFSRQAIKSHSPSPTKTSNSPYSLQEAHFWQYHCLRPCSNRIKDYCGTLVKPINSWSEEIHRSPFMNGHPSTLRYDMSRPSTIYIL